MPFKKFKGFSGKTYQIASGVLLAIVLLETFWLVHDYSVNHPSTRMAKQGPLPTAKKNIKKEPAIKIIPSARPQPTVPPTEGAQGKIAIIVDDSGYNIRDCDYLHAIQAPVTISIMPNLKHSTEIAQCAHSYQKEVMLHLPLEPHENMDEYPANYVITTEMPKGLVIDRFEESLQSVPYADGINNHMGSKATENRRLMSIIFGQLNSRKLFFVDSRVTAKTICPQLARETGLPFAQRDVFLDNVNERPQIEQQFAELARIARKHGSAIAIGHARQLTWEIIKEQTEKLTQEGFQIVPVRKIINGNE